MRMQLCASLFSYEIHQDYHVDPISLFFSKNGKRFINRKQVFYELSQLYYLRCTIYSGIKLMFCIKRAYMHDKNSLRAKKNLLNVLHRMYHHRFVKAHLKNYRALLFEKSL